MLVTKHAAELCALLVNDLYGELPSRVLIALLTKGRANIGQLAQQTTLNPRHIRNGLSVLIQQNLLYHHTDPDSRGTSYEANPDACYNLVRSGKILEAIDSQYGTAERDLVQTLMLLGYARIADLTHAFVSRTPKVNGHTNGAHDSSSGLIESEDDLYEVLARLIQAEIIETVRPESFRNPADVYHEIELEVTKTAPGEKSTKTKSEQQHEILDRLRNFRDQSTILKRQLDQSSGPAAKKRKLQNGRGQNGHSFPGDVPELNPNIVVRINHQKCLVQLRNRRLANFAADTLGQATGDVYRTLLELVTTEFSRCRADPLCDDAQPTQRVAITTMEIYDHLDEGNALGGIGKAPKDKIDFRSAEKVKANPPGLESDSEDSDGGPLIRNRPAAILDSDDDDESDESEEETNVGQQKSHDVGKTNGDGKAKVKFEDDVASPESRLDKMRQHLLLLSESKHRFIRHCGTHGRGQWTVDFEELMTRLRESELDAFIEQSFGRHGLRLTRILRERGKLDEKMLPSAALMKKSDVQGKMLAMQMAGLVDVQEVPKDNSRLANRTLFFWFFDGDRPQSQLLDDIYKAMLRCLQTLEVERHKERNILTFVERKDVKGKEEEVMTAEHYNKYNRHLEVQEKLLGQVMRLDDMVAVFRDY